MILPERIAAELTRLHRPGTYYAGLSPAGQAWLEGGGRVGPDPNDLPISQAMNVYTMCMTCSVPGGLGNHWPCETAALLVEAGLMPRVEPADPAGDG